MATRETIIRTCVLAARQLTECEEHDWELAWHCTNVTGLSMERHFDVLELLRDLQRVDIEQTAVGAAKQSQRLVREFLARSH